jgi:6,7-dimethyl-8-ribityllumazine synthase
MYGNGGCVPSPADVLEPTAISGSLAEDLRKAATRNARTALGAATGSVEVVGVQVAVELPVTTATLSRPD